MIVGVKTKVKHKLLFIQQVFIKTMDCLSTISAFLVVVKGIIQDTLSKK